MRTIKDIINFDGIIKNRIGPFKLALKDTLRGLYIARLGKGSRSNVQDDIYDYFSNYAQANKSEIITDKKYFEMGGEKVKIFLVSAAGEIELQEKDFRLMKGGPRRDALGRFIK